MRRGGARVVHVVHPHLLQRKNRPFAHRRCQSWHEACLAPPRRSHRCRNGLVVVAQLVCGDHNLSPLHPVHHLQRYSAELAARRGTLVYHHKRSASRVVVGGHRQRWMRACVGVRQDRAVCANKRRRGLCAVVQKSPQQRGQVVCEHAQLQCAVQVVEAGSRVARLIRLRDGRQVVAVDPKRHAERVEEHLQLSHVVEKRYLRVERRHLAVEFAAGKGGVRAAVRVGVHDGAVREQDPRLLHMVSKRFAGHVGVHGVAGNGGRLRLGNQNPCAGHKQTNDDHVLEKRPVPRVQEPRGYLQELQQINHRYLATRCHTLPRNEVQIL
eukprot:Rhum_TRINITY_DN5743_c0_g1::Rhum_TRINITY_DN5743_c0_g1_i1::g.18104::m.18104